MTETPDRNPYAVRLTDLEREAHVPLAEQVTEQAVAPAPAATETWDEEHRQARLAGGA